MYKRTKLFIQFNNVNSRGAFDSEKVIYAVTEMEE